MPVIEAQKLNLVEANFPGILPDITGVIDSAWQLPELARFDRFQMANTQFRILRDGFEANSFSLPPVNEAENVSVHIVTTFVS